MKKIKLFAILLLSLKVAFAQFDKYHEIELITFETESKNFQQASPTTIIWQIGKPSKSKFSEAYSLPYAIVTDTLNSYPANNRSWFDLVLPLEDFLCYYQSVNISFYHKINTDTNLDGGYITVSYDMGKTWQNIIKDTVDWFSETPKWAWTFNSNLYTIEDTLFNGENGFSGNIDDWQEVMFEWANIAVKKSSNFYEDTMMVRFNFISDSINNYGEGWMIDNLHLISVDYGGAIHDFPFKSNLECYPNPFHNFAAIRSKDKRDIKLIQVYNLTGQLLKENENTGSEYQFYNDRLPSGTYLMKCKFANEKSETIKLIIN